MKSPTEQELREKIAELEHTQWQSWAKVRNPEHLLLNVSYTKLTEEQKDQDRFWADQVLVLVKQAGYKSQEEVALMFNSDYRRGYVKLDKDVEHIVEDLLKAGWLRLK